MPTSRAAIAAVARSISTSTVDSGGRRQCVGEVDGYRRLSDPALLEGDAHGSHTYLPSRGTRCSQIVHSLHCVCWPTLNCANHSNKSYSAIWNSGGALKRPGPSLSVRHPLAVRWFIRHVQARPPSEVDNDTKRLAQSRRRGRRLGDAEATHHGRTGSRRRLGPRRRGRRRAGLANSATSTSPRSPTATST